MALAFDIFGLEIVRYGAEWSSGRPLGVQNGSQFPHDW
jgi:hypothetical protein